jgi:hypothetical protein
MLALGRTSEKATSTDTGQQMSGTSGGGSSGGGADLGIGPALEKLRRDNSLADSVHDPSEDEPRIVRQQVEPHARAVISVPATRHNWLAIIFVTAVILAAIVAIIVGAVNTAQVIGHG